MASINIAGETSGTLTLSAPLVAGSNTVTLPAATGTISLLAQATAVASTSGTSIDFTGIPSWVKRITVMFSEVSTNGSSNPLIQLGTSSGPTTSGYLGSSSIIGASVASSNYTAGFGIRLVDGSAHILHGSIIFTLLSGNTWTASGVLARSDFAGTGTVAGRVALSTTLDRVRITTVNGTDTFDAGSINIIYEG
jgi:hypothetical protein